MYQKCPLCGKDLYQNTWSDDRSVVEFTQECFNKTCLGYKHHWYYGTSDLRVGNFSVNFPDHPYLEKKDASVAKHNWKNFKEQIKKYKLQMLIK